jgi:hypothetical protein
MKTKYEKPTISSPILTIDSSIAVESFTRGDEMHCGHETSSALSIEFFTSISEGQWLDPTSCTR